MAFIMPLKLQMAGESLACVRDVYSSNALDLRISIAVKLRKVSLVSSLSINDKVRKKVRINMTIGDKLKMWEWQIYLVTLGRAAYAICYLMFRSLQSRDRCNDAKFEHGSFLCIFPLQYDFKSDPKYKAGMCSFPDSDCTSLKYPTMAIRTLKPLFQGTSAAAPGKRNSDKHKKILSTYWWWRSHWH